MTLTKFEIQSLAREYIRTFLEPMFLKINNFEPVKVYISNLGKVYRLNYLFVGKYLKGRLVFVRVMTSIIILVVVKRMVGKQGWEVSEIPYAFSKIPVANFIIETHQIIGYLELC